MISYVLPKKRFTYPASKILCLRDVINKSTADDEDSVKFVSSFTYLVFSLLLKDLISDFYLTSLQLVLCRVAAVKRLPVHQP